MYEVFFLPLARQDLVEIVSYISHELGSPQAAQQLATEILAVTDKLAEFPYSHEAHSSEKPLKQEYRKLIIENYIAFYWVDEHAKQVTVARVLHGRRDYERIL
ncbi:MAG: type II toxin-antitoxin system RelE/ParE family toxin [Coriobacteriia bacterium]|nr:type II toxin-antitoxin system RelE/ParE family toxin [Coriobacteriia bacterium]